MPDDHSAPPALARHENGRFGPGNPGRKPGSRGRRGSRVVAAILDDFMENKEAALKHFRYNSSPAYLNTIVKLLPAQSEVELSNVSGWSDAEVDEAMKRVRHIMAIGGVTRDILLQIEAVFDGD